METTANTVATETTNAIEDFINDAVSTATAETGKLSDFFDTIGDKIRDALPLLLFAVFVFFVGLTISKLILRIFNKCLKRSNVDQTAVSFLKSLVKIILYTILFIITLSVLKIPMTSIIAVISAAGLAIGLALQDSLANLAGGFIILFSKPFKAGDFIDTNSASGTVESISILYTKIISPDNKTIYIPNGKVVESHIVNYNEKDIRRVDLEFGISYDNDLERAKNIIIETAQEHPMIIDIPDPPFVRLGKHDDSCLQLTTRFWTETDNYWQVKYDMLEQVNKAFKENNINIPYKQLDVHIN